MKGLSRGRSFVMIAVLYAIATAAALLVFRLFLPGGVLPASLLGDVVATLIVWLFGVLCGNSSVYDPYWSVAPLVLLPAWLAMGNGQSGLLGVLLLMAVYIWGLRLTVNWAIRWDGLGHQDWRYTMLRRQIPGLWFIVNLAGINLMPTLLVFFAMVPAYFALSGGAQAGILSYIGIAMSLVAVAVELLADAQMELFRGRTGRGEHIDEGLWRLSRHPNYFGEVLFWWGIWLTQVGARPALWATVAAPVLVTLLFFFVSIPMMERHILESWPAYRAYQREVSPLVPFFRRKLP